MIDVRIGLAIDAAANDKLVALCEKLDISKGAFVTAMITYANPQLIEQAVVEYKTDHEAKREEKLAQRKAVAKKLKSLTPEEIDKILAARESA